jgi:hypothetical protein
LKCGDRERFLLQEGDARSGVAKHSSQRPEVHMTLRAAGKKDSHLNDFPLELG